MPSLEQRIDDLYRAQLDEFVPARAALAKTLAGDDRTRVKALKKPTAVPWAVNQVYWRARPLFDRLQKSGADLRRAQVAALEGRKSDVRTAGEAHRSAIAAAVKQAIELSEAAGIHPGRDVLAQTFEALSLDPEPNAPAGRLTEPLRPRGFEMLAGVKPVAFNIPASKPAAARPASPPKPDRRAEEAKRRHEAEIARLEQAVARARVNAAAARRAADEAAKELAEAQSRLDEARAQSG